MFLPDIRGEDFLPLFIIAIPIVAIVGGITAGIVKTIGQQRLLEMAQRERIAAIERGVDPAKLPPLPAILSDDYSSAYLAPHEYARRRSQGLMIGGIITLAAGMGVVVFLMLIERDRNFWAAGLIPAFVGVALLLSAWIVSPRGNGSSGGPPRAT